MQKALKLKITYSFTLNDIIYLLLMLEIYELKIIFLLLLLKDLKLF